MWFHRQSFESFRFEAGVVDGALKPGETCLSVRYGAFISYTFVNIRAPKTFM